MAALAARAAPGFCCASPFPKVLARFAKSINFSFGPSMLGSGKFPVAGNWLPATIL